ncbi:hypothetical protein [Pseudomonas sp. BIC9C]|uniref:hypothetical protein n=1 Tax=Pseudomonas sp. BIC9C TaxID=3078458 RepID=UPI002AD3B6AB|nr:hypothetical protein [Pseudomonas sp. BIC9C]
MSAQVALILFWRHGEANAPYAHNESKTAHRFNIPGAIYVTMASSGLGQIYAKTMSGASEGHRCPLRKQATADDDSL